MQEINKAEFYTLATAPTTNDMFDDGAWLAPVLTSTDPTVDKRAAHKIHYFADDTRLSVCGHRFLADHYVDTPDIGADGRSRCQPCSQLVGVNALEIDPTRYSSLAREPILPDHDVYGAEEFYELFHGPRRPLGLRINRVVVINDDLHLMVDIGLTPHRAVRRLLRLHNVSKTRAVDEVILVATDAVRSRLDQGNNTWHNQSSLDARDTAAPDQGLGAAEEKS